MDHNRVPIWKFSVPLHNSTQTNKIKAMLVLIKELICLGTIDAIVESDSSCAI